MGPLLLRRFAAVLALSGFGPVVATVASAAPAKRPPARSTPAKPAPPPRPTVVRVEATIVDMYSGAPAAGATLHLNPLGGNPGPDVVADASGRVVFEGVAPDTYRVEVKVGTFYDAALKPGADGSLYFDIPPGDLGTIAVPLRSWVEPTLGPQCDKARKTDARPMSMVLFKAREDGWRLDTLDVGKVRASWTHPWNGVVCVESEYRTVGRYVTSNGQSGGDAKQETIKVKVIRLDTGKQYKTKITGKPPEEITVGKYGGLGAYGDTSEELRSWIDKLPD